MHLPGHLGVTLLLAAPVVLLLGGRKGMAFTALAAPFSMLPDVDLILPGVAHHGFTHTVAFVVLASLVVAAVLTAAYRALGVARRTGGELTSRAVFEFVASAVALAGLGHVGLDLLSAPDIGQALEPLWPIYGAEVVSLDLLPLHSDLWNFGLLAIGGIVWIAAYVAARSGDQASKSVSEV